jgi:hypothetical protein
MATKAYRVRFVYDNDAQFEECNGEARPLTEDEYRDNEYMKDGAPVSYADYLDYYGNPLRHVYLGCEVQTQCDCCGMWKHAASLWNIDFMDDRPELNAVYPNKWFTPENAASWPGYLKEVAQEVLREAGYLLTL